MVSSMLALFSFLIGVYLLYNTGKDIKNDITKGKNKLLTYILVYLPSFFIGLVIALFIATLLVDSELGESAGQMLWICWGIFAYLIKIILVRRWKKKKK